MEPISRRDGLPNKITLEPISNNNRVEGFALFTKQVASLNEKAKILFRIETTYEQDNSISCG
jgi:hypothetical protein